MWKIGSQLVGYKVGRRCAVLLQHQSQLDSFVEAVAVGKVVFSAQRNKKNSKTIIIFGGGESKVEKPRRPRLIPQGLAEMFYQNGHQPPPYGQQPPYPQQNNLHYGGYHGGGVGSASASSASGDAILEFPSPYGGPPPIFGGGYAPSGPPAGNTYGAPQQQSTYAPMPHFTPQQPQPQPSNPPVQQPAPPPAGGKPLFQPSGASHFQLHCDPSHY